MNTLKNFKLKLNIALVSILIYELCMTLFHLDGVSLFKLILTGLIWVSCTIAIYYFYDNYSSIKKNIPTSAFFILVLLLFWNVTSIVRSALFDTDSINTIFGNIFTSLSLLVPFALAFSFRSFSLPIVQRYFIILLKFGIILFIILFVISGGSFSTSQILILYTLLQPAAFMITIIPYQNKWNKVFIAIASLLLLYVAFFYGIRTMVIREILLMACLVAIYLYVKFRWKWILYLSYLTLLLPLVLVQQSVATGESAIKKYLSESSDDELSIDTRTFVYMELFQDLVNNDQLIIGKGANGRYYSDYFSTQEGDADVRLGVEVGVLGMMLKGGVIAVALNLLILFIAIYHALFKSKNYFVIGIGFMLVVHVSLLFIENVISYSTYNFLIWFFIGICLSKQIRHLNNSEISYMLNPKKKLR